MLTGACRRLKFYAMLTLEKLIVDTHSDFSPWSAVSVGFTDDRNFVIELEYRGYDPTELYAGADDHASDYDLLAIVSFDDALSFQNGAWSQEFLVTNADGAPTYTEDDLKDPLFPAADEVASQNAVFSDYTIKDNMIFSNDATDEELIVDVSGSFDMNEEVQDILSDYLLSMWQPSLPILTLEDIFEQGFNVFGSNLASVLFYDIDSTLQSYLKNHQDSFYSDFMTDLVAWLNANPDTPVWTINVVITGKYSTFEKTFTVRYDPSTVQMSVWSVSLDEENVVM